MEKHEKLHISLIHLGIPLVPAMQPCSFRIPFRCRYNEIVPIHYKMSGLQRGVGHDLL